jgi:hypothetical protein
MDIDDSRATAAGSTSTMSNELNKDNDGLATPP